MITKEFETAQEFDAALQAANAKPHDPIDGDGRQYYTGTDENGDTVEFCEDTTTATPHYWQYTPA